MQSPPLHGARPTSTAFFDNANQFLLEPLGVSKVYSFSKLRHHTLSHSDKKSPFELIQIGIILIGELQSLNLN